MARVPDLDPGELSPAQKRIHDDIAAKRGGTVRGPFALWLRRPEIAERANAFGNALRADGRIDKRLFELMVLIVARHWSAQYAWFAHERHALKAGLPAEIIEAIRHGRQPEFARDDEKLVYDIVTELNQSRDLSEPSYRRGVALFGLDLFIEFVTAIGFYIMVAVMLKTFDAPVPDGTRPLPD